VGSRVLRLSRGSGNINEKEITMKMNRTHDDETNEIWFSISGFPIKAYLAEIGGTGVFSVQLQDNGGTVATHFPDSPVAEATAKRELWKFYKGLAV
jgi:hypothetical protein